LPKIIYIKVVFIKVYNFYMKLISKIKSHKKVTIILILIVIAASVAGYFLVMSNNKTQNNNSSTTEAADTAEVQSNQNPTTDQSQPESTSPAQTPSTPPSASQWPVQLTSAEAASITVVVNKKHKLPSSYAPTLGPSGRLRTEAEAAFSTMVDAAKVSGAPNITYVSGYRSYAKQEQVYNGYVASDGQAAADTYSARPGFSEHQTGLAVDIGESGSGCDLETCFENTASGIWAANNSYKYGFVIRYPKGKEAITGYQYEPWHLRYLGITEATAVFNSGKTLEEYYGIAGGGYE
jgi:D-alanyl-D-alanine carboxypeptidase